MTARERPWRFLTSTRSRRARLASTGLIRQFNRFILVGVSNTLLSFVSYTILIGVDIVYWAAGAIAFMIGAVNGYLLNRRWTFACPDSSRARLKYLVVQLAGLGATTALLWFFVSDAGISRIAAFAVTIPAVTVATFLANRSWTFRGGLRTEASSPARRAP